MSRSLRLDFPGALWHVFSRGNERRPIYRTDSDRNRFLDLLAKVAIRFRWELYCYCLMTNHYHLVLESVEGNLSRAMQALNAAYAQEFNASHGRVGHLFQGRFKAVLVERETHLLELIRYVVLNPVRAGMVGSAEQWPWSSYRATAGFAPAPPWLAVEAVLSRFGAEFVEEAQRRYRQFVKERENHGIQPELEVTNQVCIGSDAFKLKIRDMARARRSGTEFPREHWEPWRPDIEDIIVTVGERFGRSPEEIRSSHGGPARMAVAYLARRDAVIPVRRVSQALRLSSASAVSHLVRAGELLESEPAFAVKLAAVRQCLEAQTLGDSTD